MYCCHISALHVLRVILGLRICLKIDGSSCEMSTHVLRKSLLLKLERKQASEIKINKKNIALKAAARPDLVPYKGNLVRSQVPNPYIRRQMDLPGCDFVASLNL